MVSKYSSDLTILIFSMHQVRDHLKDYLDRSYRLLEENEAEVADQNLYLLIIQCFEVCVCVCVHACMRAYVNTTFSSSWIGCTV